MLVSGLIWEIMMVTVIHFYTCIPGTYYPSGRPLSPHNNSWHELHDKRSLLLASGGRSICTKPNDLPSSTKVSSMSNEERCKDSNAFDKYLHKNKVISGQWEISGEMIRLRRIPFLVNLKGSLKTRSGNVFYFVYHEDDLWLRKFM